ncbi:MAG: hypothetical protein R3F43_19150 [bacterium]
MVLGAGTKIAPRSCWGPSPSAGAASWARTWWWSAGVCGNKREDPEQCVGVLGVILEDDVFVRPSIVFTNVGTRACAHPAPALTTTRVCQGGEHRGQRHRGLRQPAGATPSWARGRW